MVEIVVYRLPYLVKKTKNWNTELIKHSLLPTFLDFTFSVSDGRK